MPGRRWRVGGMLWLRGGRGRTGWDMEGGTEIGSQRKRTNYESKMWCKRPTRLSASMA